MFIFLGIILTLIVILAVVWWLVPNKCCYDEKNMKITLSVPAESVLFGFQVILQIEKCSVCGKEHAYKITEHSKTSIQLDFLNGILDRSKL